jgi:hypothetical protein
MALKHPPSSHSKNAVTGTGQMPRVPGNSGSKGPSNHVPKTGKY